MKIIQSKYLILDFTNKHDLSKINHQSP